MGLLEKQVALVTGGAQGIGKGVATEFAREGADVAIVDLKLENAKLVAEELSKEFGVKALAFKADASSADETFAVVAEVEKEFGKIDILVTAAGIDIAKSIADMTVRDWELTFDINTKGVFLAVKAVAEVMKKNKSGKIVNLSSCCAKTGEKNNSAYCASKAAVTLFTDCAARELGEYGIRVNAMCPATIDTPMMADAFRSKAAARGITVDEFKAAHFATYPMARMGKVEEVGRLAVFLASDQAAFMTGQSINITGGYEMH